jgi:hypothetical protein
VNRNCWVCFAFMSLVISQATAQTQLKQGALYVDVSQFAEKDICLDIQAAIATLPTNPAITGAVIDARNFAPPTGQTWLSCSVNPFAIFNQPTSPMVLVGAGYCTTCTPTPVPITPGSSGGVLLLPGTLISTDVPWYVPLSWSVIGEGANVTQLAPSSIFQAPGVVGMISGAASGSVAITVNSTFTSGSVVGAIVIACNTTGCTPSYQNAALVGIVTDQPPTPTSTFNLGTGAQTACGTPHVNCGYIFAEPVMAWASTNICASVSCTGALTPTSGSLIQDINIDCSANAGGGTPAANCIPFWDQYGQERSQLRRVKITNFNMFGIGVYTGASQNGGPFDDLQIVFGSGATASTTCIEAGGNGVGGPNPMRGVRGLTCVGTPPGSAIIGTGVDINERNFVLRDAHFENMTTGVFIGQFAPAAGIRLDNISGGGKTSFLTKNLVEISNTCATATGSCSFATGDISLSNIYQPTGATGPALTDQIAGNNTSEITLGFYSLGDGTTSGGVSNRPVVTTSSSFGSSPYLIGMTLPPVTGVQGSTGTLVQMSAGTASGNLVKFDVDGNTVDSGVSATNPTFTGTTVGTLAATTVSGNPNFSGTPTFSNTVALNTTGTSGGLTGTPNVTVGTVSAAAITGTSITGTSINQPTGTNPFGGTCTMSSGTTCTVMIGHSYSSTPICVTSEQSSSTFAAGSCSVSGATVTVKASAMNSATWGVFVFGNPN